MNATVALAAPPEHTRRQYGSPKMTLTDRAAIEAPPEVGVIFIEDIQKNSAIFQLNEDSTHEQILAAYGHDLDALKKRFDEANAFIYDVVNNSVTNHGLDKWQKQNERKALERLLHPICDTPFILLGADQWSMKPGERLCWLKGQFTAELDKVARRIAAALHLFVDNRVIGLVDWREEPDICMFSYYTWDFQHTSASKEEKEFQGDIRRWNTLVTTTTTTETTVLSSTKHVHHLACAATHMVADYKRPMPKRVLEIIKVAPAWLKPHLMVVDGTETLVETETNVIGKKSDTTVTKKAVKRYDPALTLGNFVLAGWNEDDLKKPKRRSISQWFNDMSDDDQNALVGGSIICGAILLIASLFLWHWIAFWNFESYAKSIQEKAGSSLVNVDPGKPVIKDDRGTLCYIGLGDDAKESLRFSFSPNATDASGKVNTFTFDVAFPDNYGDMNHHDMPYGTVDLSGYPAKLPYLLHVCEVTGKSGTSKGGDWSGAGHIRVAVEKK